MHTKTVNIDAKATQGSAVAARWRRSVTSMPFAVAVGVLLSLLGLCAPQSLSAAPGDLDQTFGTGGKVTTPFGSGFGEARGLAIQPDGKLVVVGTATPPDPTELLHFHSRSLQRRRDS